MTKFRRMKSSANMVVKYCFIHFVKRKLTQPIPFFLSVLLQIVLFLHYHVVYGMLVQQR